MSRYDARVGFLPKEGTPRLIYALAKQTIRGGCVDRPEPLTEDLLHPDSPAKLSLGSDCWIDRPWVDVVVLGSAHSPRPVKRMRVEVIVGEHRKRVEVFGHRLAKWDDAGRIHFTDPEPFTTMELGLHRAYGGVDMRVPVPSATSADDVLRRTCDHPGLYPRNPYGRGYIVSSEAPRSGQIELPNLEDPDRLLTPERLALGDPTRWWEQPVPATLGYLSPDIFPRYVHGGARPWFPAPDDARLPEVRCGALAPGALSAPQGLDPFFWQEASVGLAFPELKSGTRITIRGMHPTRAEVAFSIPSPPPCEVVLEGRVQRLAMRLQRVVIRPADETITLTWAARTEQMHRLFLPGIHAEIPLAVHVADDAPIPYATPRTIRSRIDAGRNPDGSLPRPPRPRLPRA